MRKRRLSTIMLHLLKQHHPKIFVELSIEAHFVREYEHLSPAHSPIFDAKPRTT